jgi:imidazolonepropionase-like amidohydrolase
MIREIRAVGVGCLFSSWSSISRKGTRPRILAAAATALLVAQPAAAQLAVRAATLHTSAGAPIADGVVLIGANGKIEKVGPASSVPIPSGYTVLEAVVATPGLVDAHSVVGLAGAMNQPHDQMQVEGSAAIQPELRAIDAYNARDPLVAYLRGHGVTTIHTGHAPAALVSGQTMVAKTRGGEVDDAVLVPVAMIASALGPDGLGSAGKSPGTRAKAVAMLRAELLKAKDYVAKQAGAEDKRPARDLRLEALGRVLKKEIPLLVTAETVTDILAALRVAEEFGIRLVLDGGSESFLVLDRIKAAGVPVILHPTMARAGGERENLSMETAAVLRKAGVPFALQGGYESYVPKTRVVLFEAAIAAANGLTPSQALDAITIDAARIAGVDARVGSLEPGKDGDVALFDGDPFEYVTHVTRVVVDGIAFDGEAQ